MNQKQKTQKSASNRREQYKNAGLAEKGDDRIKTERIISEEKIKDLEKQGYRIVGNHSAIKVCEWCKKAIRHYKEEDVCYKNTFYGIKSWQCVQMTPALPFCTHRCVFCWRDILFTKTKWSGPVDDPKSIVDECIKAHTKYLVGFGGLKEKDDIRFAESMQPKHFAISLSGEPTMYPKLDELIEEIHSRGMTSFVVTNGTNPEGLKKLLKHQPTQLYLTMPAPDETTYKKTCAPLTKNGWKNLLKSLKLLSRFSCRKTLRFTLVKGLNMDAKAYAKLIAPIRNSIDFFEAKAYMWVGYSRERLSRENMPLHEDIIQFSKIFSERAGLKIIDEKKESRVILMMNPEEDPGKRFLKIK